MAKKEQAKKEQRTKSELERLRSIAEDYYIRLGKSGREIAEVCEVSEQTISNWKKGREGERSWDERKKFLQLTPITLKELLMLEAQKIVKGEESKLNADQLSKIMVAIDRLDKTVNARTVMAVLQKLDNFTAEINPKLAIEATKTHKLFLQHIISLES